MVDCDVLIVGAGPAGCAAAISAQRLGLKSIVVDKAEFPRDKCCGDGLTAMALREIEGLGLRPTAASWTSVTDVWLKSPFGKTIKLDLPEDGQYAAIVKREDLDFDLLRLAAESGAEINEGLGFKDIALTSDGAVVSLDDGRTISAGSVVAADGMWSSVRKRLGCTPNGYRGDWHAFRQYAGSESPLSRDLWVWFEKDLLPGYAWSFPLADGQVNLGFGVVRGGTLDGKKLAQIWNGLMDRPSIREILGELRLQGQRTAWPIPASLPSAQLSMGPVLFVGDAATATDPLTGEGIGQALESGRLAAEAISEAGNGQTAAIIYESRVRAALSLDHRFSRSLSKVLSRPRLAEAALSVVDTNDWTRRNFARWMFEDYPRAAVLDPRRWQKGLFKTRGAWSTTN